MSAKRPTLPMTGGCLCGAIRYEISAFPLLLYTCNCTDCQTSSGSAFALNMPVATKSFRILRGEPKGWRHKSPSGADVTSWFCGECGSALFSRDPNDPEQMSIRLGTFDGDPGIRPSTHSFVAYAARWEAIPDDGLPRHAESAHTE